MRLSEAIKLGAMLRPQAFGGLWKDGGSCAVGAAYDALGWISKTAAISEAPPVVQQFNALRLPCPACYTEARWGYRGPSIVVGDGIGIVAHLNDHHRWTRERIADWVETVEPAPAPVAGPAMLPESLAAMWLTHTWRAQPAAPPAHIITPPVRRDARILEPA